VGALALRGQRIGGEDDGKGGLAAGPNAGFAKGGQEGRPVRIRRCAQPDERVGVRRGEGAGSGPPGRSLDEGRRRFDGETAAGQCG
jgi:hypothetical protein